MIDNKKNGTVTEELRLELTKDSKLSVMTAYFTIFAFAELKKELIKVQQIRLLFKMFDELWNDGTAVEDVKAGVLEQIQRLYKENTTEFIYFLPSIIMCSISTSGN